MPPTKAASASCGLAHFHVPPWVLVLPCLWLGPRGQGRAGAGRKEQFCLLPPTSCSRRFRSSPPTRGKSWSQVWLPVLVLLPGSCWAASKRVSSSVREAGAVSNVKDRAGLPCPSARSHLPEPCPARQGSHFLPCPGWNHTSPSWFLPTWPGWRPGVWPRLKTAWTPPPSVEILLDLQALSGPLDASPRLGVEEPDPAAWDAWIPLGTLVGFCHVPARTPLPVGSPLPRRRPATRFGAKLCSKPFGHK